MFHSCTILVYSISHTGFLLRLGRFQNYNVEEFDADRFKLEAEDFIFHVMVFSREAFQILTWKFLVCIPHKVLKGLYFSLFCSGVVHIVQSLVSQDVYIIEEYLDIYDGSYSREINVQNALEYSIRRASLPAKWKCMHESFPSEHTRSYGFYLIWASLHVI